VLVLLRKYSEELVTGTEVLAPAAFGGLLIAMVFVLPGGIVGGLRSLADRVLPAGPAPAPAGPPGASGPPGAAAPDEPDPPTLTKETP
jgi:hypothetical protein